MAYPDLESYVPEYLTGVSGRKYHVVGEKIYDFSTGKPVNVNEALTDADNYLTMQTQKIMICLQMLIIRLQRWRN